MRRLLRCSPDIPFGDEQFVVDLTMFTCLEDVAMTLPPIKPDTTTGHALFRTEFNYGSKGKGIKFRKSPNVSKSQMLSVTEDKDLTKNYFPQWTEY